MKGIVSGTAIGFVFILVLQMLTPNWWWILVVPFLYGSFRASTFREGLVAGGGSAGLVWLAGSIYFYFTGSRIIAERTAGMFGLDLSWLMILLTAIAAAGAGALAGLSGYSVKSIFTKISV